MTFEDLPPGWATRPITDADLFEDVVDLVVREQDRHEGAVHLLICDGGHRLLQPVAVATGRRTGTTVGVHDDERRLVLTPFAAALAQEHTDGGMVVVTARPGDPQPTDADRAWYRVAAQVCRDHGLALLGFFVASPAGIRRADTAFGPC